MSKKQQLLKKHRQKKRFILMGFATFTLILLISSLFISIIAYFIRMLACARIMMPKSHVRLSAGREQMNEQMQALAFLAGANSIFYGDRLLTTTNPQVDKDQALFAKLGIMPEAKQDHADEVHQAAIEQAIVEQRQSSIFYDAAKV